MLVAIVVPDPETLLPWAAQNQKGVPIPRAKQTQAQTQEQTRAQARAQNF